MKKLVIIISYKVTELVMLLFYIISETYTGFICARKEKSIVLLYPYLRKRPLDTPKRMIERRGREGEREKER